MSNRLDANIKVLRLIEDYCILNPDQRLHQVLQNIKVVEFVDGKVRDQFYEEPQTTLNRVLNTLKEIL